MSTFIAVVVYGAFALGYIAMLALTERTAGRYVRGEIAQLRPSATLVAFTPVRWTPPAVDSAPALSPVTARVA